MGFNGSMSAALRITPGTAAVMTEEIFFQVICMRVIFLPFIDKFYQKLVLF